jgi:hypothetical protein
MKTNILKYFLIVIMAFVSALSVSAQTPTEPVYTHPADTIVYEAPPLVDTTLVGTDIFDVLHLKKSNGKAAVALHQSKAIEESVRTHIIANKGRTLNSYRIRIFFDNSQDARVNSGGAYGTFLKIFKGIPAYRSYVNPYFKVSVGDFRTKAEAMEKLIHIKKVFPAAFIVKEKIRFPHVDRATLEDLPDSLEVFKL